MRRRAALVLSILLLGAGTVTANVPAHAAPGIDSGAKPSPAQPTRYRIKSGPVAAAMAERAGAVVTEQEDGFTEIQATPSQASALRARGLRLTSMATLTATAGDPVDPGYTDYAEMMTAVDGIVASHPSIASKTVLGQSFEGRDIVALKISDNVADDEAEPEMLFTANQHAREHLTVEMALALARMLTDDYGTDLEITNTVNDREIWIIPMVNPDGVSFDMDSGTYQMWRKNRQPNGAFVGVGTDLNRNWGYKWGCCRGSSPDKSEETYRGSAAFSAPETRAVRDFVLSRRVGGVQQIKEHLDIHTFSELVLWPFGYTFSTVVPRMTADQYAVHKAIGTEFAMANGYWPAQSSGLYITDGDIVDWIWGDQGIFSFTIEMFPKEDDLADNFYPPASVIPAETARNRAALLRFATWADCPYRAIGKENTYCPLTDDFKVTAPATATVAQGSDVTLNVSALKTAGTDQLVIMDTEGLPPAATATFSGSGLFLTDGSPETVTIHTTAATTPGKYTVILTGDGITTTTGRRTARVALTVTGQAECAGTNGTDVTIPDGTAAIATSNITIAGCGGNGGTAARVDLKIKHTHIGDLVIDLKAPSGVWYHLHTFGTGADVDNIDRSYTVNLSGESVDGTWTLEASDLTTGDPGKIDSWSLTLK